MDLLLLSFSLKSCIVVSPCISFFLQVFRLQSYVGGFAIVVFFFEVLYCCFTLNFILFYRYFDSRVTWVNSLLLSFSLKSCTAVSP